MTIAGDLLPAARDARDRVLARLVERLGRSGAIHDRCQSRILESALLLRLLEKEGGRTELRASLVSYLERAEGSGFLEDQIARAALGRPGPPDEIARYLDRFQHFTGERKRMMLTTVLWLVGAIPLAPMPSLARIHYRGYATWTEVTLCAIKILHDDTPGGAGGHVTDDDREFLVERLRAFETGSVWQGNVLAHLIALHALHTYQPGSSLLEDGISAIERERNDDGGVPFISGQEVWITALAGTAMAEAACPPALLTRMGDYLAGHQLPDGGWGYEETTTQSDVDDTSRCADFLRRVDPTRYRHELDRAHTYLTAIAGPDGGFPTYLQGHQPEVDLTAGALIALAPSSEHHPDLSRASLKFLLAAQHDDGTFEKSWTRSESSVIGHVLAALVVVRSSSPAYAEDVDRVTSASLERLRGSQNADGGWGHRRGDASDVISTAHAVSSLIGRGERQAARGGVDYLIRGQYDNGTYPTVPDQVGPRPIPYTFPALTEVHALSALSQVANSVV